MKKRKMCLSRKMLRKIRQRVDRESWKRMKRKMIIMALFGSAQASQKKV
jgi:hypothetical protein